MIDELYSYDCYYYLGYDIYIMEDCGIFWGEISEKSIGFKKGIKSSTGDGCLDKCKDWVDAQVNTDF